MKTQPPTWSTLPAAHQPDWPNQAQAADVLNELKGYVPLVLANEVRGLHGLLGRVANRQAFALWGGPCAETFPTSGVSAPIRRLVSEALLPIGVILQFALGLPVVKIGRYGGQYAKPRSSATETVATSCGTQTLPTYFGDLINGPDFTLASRTPDPTRMLLAYNFALQTLHFASSIAHSPFAGLDQIVHQIEAFAAQSGDSVMRSFVDNLRWSVQFMAACHGDAELAQVTELFSSHEALNLEFEDALSRIDSRTGTLYGLSAHFLWIGERTRQPDHGHVAFAASIANPVGVKLGPTATPQDVVQLCAKLNPGKIPGRLTFIVRMGAKQVSQKLGRLIDAVQGAGYGDCVVWASDPMHGNTIRVGDYKTRLTADITEEVIQFIRTCRAHGAWPGGMLLELAGENDITECIGSGVSAEDLGTNYATACDPRLSSGQGLELAFAIAAELREG